MSHASRTLGLATSKQCAPNAQGHLQLLQKKEWSSAAHECVVAGSMGSSGTNPWTAPSLRIWNQAGCRATQPARGRSKCDVSEESRMVLVFRRTLWVAPSPQYAHMHTLWAPQSMTDCRRSTSHR